eukprot:m.215900 g.215900  ORF g.215900 m.215900 type:complete len:1114 (+) comp18647_c1_seq1:271-3612(+)
MEADDETHPPARLCHPEGHTAVAYAGNDGSKLVTGGADSSVRVFKGYNDEDALSVEHHTDAVTCLAIRDNHLVSGSADNSVALFKLRDGECTFESLLTRFQGPVRSVAFNSSGSCIAASSDDMTVRVVSMLDQTVKVLRGHDGPVLDVKVDPSGELLVTSSSDGTVRFWSIAEETCLKTLDILPKSNDTSRTGLAGLSWHPRNNYVAIPVGNAVHVYERDTWDHTFSFNKDGHTKPVSLAVWSPNGEFLASVSVDGEVMVWELGNEQQTVQRFKHADGRAITSLAWHPRINEIAWADTQGKFSLWRGPIPEMSAGMAAPAAPAGAGAEELAADQLAKLFDDDDDEPVAQRKRKRLRQKAQDSDDEDEFFAGGGVESSMPADAASKKRPSRQQDEYADDDTYVDDERNYDVISAKMQEPFQPSATPADGLRRFLVWNTVGIITSREDELSSAVDVEFHDASAHKPIKITDHFGFTLGSLGEHTFALAGPSRTPTSEDERDHPSVLFCQNIQHWGNDSSWQIFFPQSEEVEVVAVGGGETGFVAVATNKRYLRLYSNNGTPKHVMCLEGPVVSMAAFDEQLFVVYHLAHGLPDEQNLGALILDVDRRTTVYRGTVPLSIGADLTWLGFSDNKLPATMDSMQVVRVLLPTWGQTWTPIVELGNVGKKGEFHWLTGITEKEVLCVVCKGGEQFPKVLPRPMISAYSLRIPIVSSKEFAKHEELFMRSKINFDHAVSIDDYDESDPQDAKQMASTKKRMDTYMLQCISKAVQTNKPGRALDITTFLTAPASVDIAIRLAVKAKLPMLAERMSLVKAAVIEKQKAERAERRQLAASYLQRPSYLSPPPEVQRQAFKTPEYTPLQSSQKHAMASGMPAPKRPVFSSAKRKAPEEPKPSAHDDEGDDDEFEAPEVDMDSNDSAPPAKQPVQRTPAPKATPAKANPFAKKASSQAKTAVLERSTSFMQHVTGASPKQPKKRSATLSFVGLADEPDKPTHTPLTSTKKARVQAPKVVLPKKPMSAYFAWVQANRKSFKKQFPSLSNKDLLKKSGELWKEIDAEEKQKFTDKYEAQVKEWKAEVARLKGEQVPEADIETQPMGDIPAKVATGDETQPMDTGIEA